MVNRSDLVVRFKFKTRETAEQEFAAASKRLEAMVRKMTAAPAQLAGLAAESSSASGSSTGRHP